MRLRGYPWEVSYSTSDLRDDGEDTLVAAGSLNESRTALVLNAENLEIFTSWEGRGAERIRRKRRSFELMWRGEHPNIHTFELPEAIRKRLLKIADRRLAHLLEVDGTPAPFHPEPKLDPPTRVSHGVPAIFHYPTRTPAAGRRVPKHGNSPCGALAASAICSAPHYRDLSR